jgi:hypothetical protein
MKYASGETPCPWDTVKWADNGIWNFLVLYVSEDNQKVAITDGEQDRVGVEVKYLSLVNRQKNTLRLVKG